MKMLRRLMISLCIIGAASLGSGDGVWAHSLDKGRSGATLTDSSGFTGPSTTSSTESVRFPGQRPDSSISDPSTYPFLAHGQKIPAVTPRNRGAFALGPDLAYGCAYHIRTDFPDKYWQSAQAAYPDKGQLTDGNFGTLDFTDPAWLGRLYQYRHNITIDLGQPANVRGMAIDFLSNVGAGVVLPDSVQYFVSMDGHRFTPVGTVKTKNRAQVYQPDSDTYLLTGQNLNARYVRAQFTNKLWAFMDEFAVFGTPGLNPHASFANQPHGRVKHHGFHNHDADPLAVAAPGFADEGRRRDAIHNLVLVYTHGHGDLGTWHQKDFHPLVAGATPLAKGRPLFDTVLFTPYSLPSSEVAWKGWLDNLFQPAVQLGALDETIHENTKKWYAFLPAFREREGVVITIPSLGMSQESELRRAFPSAFTHRNVSNLRQRFHLENSLAGREAIFEWYIHEVIRRFSSQHYRHLRLIGLYWEPESLRVTDPHDAALIRCVAQMVHQYGLRFVWIPFYGALGVPDWRDLGFDLVMLQPNVSFQWGIDATSRLRAVGRFAKRYETGIELEAHWDVTSAYPRLAAAAQDRYFAYFRVGREIGYVKPDVPKGWYLNSKTLNFAFWSSNPLYHRVYDETVRFIRREPSALK